MKSQNWVSYAFKAMPENEFKNYVRAFIHRLRVKEYNTYYRNQIWELHYPRFIIKYHVVPSTATTNRLFFKRFTDRKLNIIIDAGGFIGTFGFLMASRYPEAKVYIFESDPVNYLKLKNNLELNDFKNVVLEPMGLWLKNDILKMNVDDNLASSIINHQESGNAIDVRVTSLDEYFKEVIGKLVFVKMNIEGAEIAAISGARSFIKNNEVELAISTDHYMDGELTYGRIEQLCLNLEMQTETLSEGIYINTYASNISL